MAQQRVVFVHGAGRVGAAAWPRQHFLAGRYDALFLRRHGYRPDLPPAPTDHRADAAAVLAALGAGGHVVAHAEGAISAMLAAVLAPERVWSLTLCEPAVFSLTRDLPATSAHRQHLQALFSNARLLSDEEYAAEYRRLVFSAEAAAPADGDPYAAARQRMQSPPWEAPLEIVPGVPTLVLTGGWEPLYEEVAGFLASTGADHRVIGGNHRPQDTDAGQEAISGFLAGSQPATAAAAG
ncbi:alpha/beta hydrolase [Arthrobacter sp. Sa2CUA1]|uniref:Alpha/beta hydrolase n=1 Tax=Arthrobacter gallicola TaxID=2762225 RepID=A0ABR8UPG9_9MICC|nr:alpha/beta hydrolase [Arthrobacter gallicola]MBD7994447.1 alpha/beta hydrolase [Arthrobacter gallicola]